MQGIAIITGASKGIGRASAAHFKEQDWRVINISRHACLVEGVENVTLDLTDVAQVDTQLSALCESLDTAPITLVHNAAFYAAGSIPAMPMTDIQRSIALNIMAPLRLNQWFLPKMAKGSSILYVGSTLSEKAVKNAAPYVITKHAVVGMMRSTCQDLENTGIHTCCVCPGFTDTEMLRSHLNNDPEVLSQITQRVCERRLVQPEEIASLLYYCANNPVINGSVLHANLGQVEY